MPLSRLQLRNEFGLGDPELYRGASVGKENTKAILDGVAVAGLVGILRKLGDVAEFGAEVFQELHEQITVTSARGHKLLSRIRGIEEALPSIEDGIGGKGSYIDLAYQTGSNWCSDMKITDTHLSCSDFPRFMMDSYEECQDPPRLYLLDKYDQGGTGACLKRYSDPSYFKRAWATSEPKNVQQIQKEKKFNKIKRKYSQVKDGEIQGPTSTAQFRSLVGTARFAPLSNDDQSFSAENSPASETRLKPEVMSGSQLLNTVNKLNCIEQVSQTNPSVVTNDLEYDRLSVSNVQNNQDHGDTSQFHSNEPLFGVDVDFQYGFMHGESTSQSPSVIWDQKSELIKSTGLKFSDDTLRDSNLLVEEPGRNGFLDHAKLFPIITDFSKSSCVKKPFEEVTEAESYVDALNTLEAEADADFECQTKCIQTFSNKGSKKNGSGDEKMLKKYTYSSTVVPPAVDSSNKCTLQSDVYLDVSSTLNLKLSTPEAGLSTTSAFPEIDDDRHPWSDEEKLETIPSSETKPPISMSSIPSIKLWTNGNLLGLQPSKPPDICLPSPVGKRTEYNSSNTSMKLDKENMAHCQRTPQLNSLGSTEGPPEALSLADNKILNNNQSLSRKYVEGHKYMEHSTPCQYDGFWAKQNSQEQSEAITFSQHEGSQGASPNVFTGRISQVHQTASAACTMEIEKHSTSNVSSPFMDSLHNRKSLSPSFPVLTRGNDNDVQGLQIKPSVIHTRSLNRYEHNVNDSQSKGKPLIDIHQKSLNGAASQTSYEPKLALQTLDEQSFINKANYGELEESIYSGFRHSQSSSPPLEHMKISFHPMNGEGESNVKVGVHDVCISREIDGHVSSSFQLFPGCTLPAQDGGSESDDDTFARSYPYTTEDLPSPRSDSNSDIWEQDECSVSKINELSDDLRRISSSTASISCNGGFEQINHVGQEIELKDNCFGNDTVHFQYGGYISSIPSLESLINHVNYDSMSTSPKNAATLVPNELPPPPPLPPKHWRLLRPSYEMSEDSYSYVSELVNRFEGPLNKNLCCPTKNENIIRRPPPLGEDGQYKKMHDNPKMDSLLQTNLSSNPFEHERSKHLLHQIRDMDVQHKLKPCEESKSQVATGKGVEEMDDLLHQIRTKTFNLRRTATSTSSVTQQATNFKVAAILEKANAIRQACASSDEADDSDEWRGA